MTINSRLTRSHLITALLYGIFLAVARLQAADPSPAIPAIIQAGIDLWVKGDSGAAFQAWQKGGLMENDRKVLAEVNYFKKMEQVLAGFKFYDMVTIQRISQMSEVAYLALNFNRAVVYARFILYRTDQDWVVQNMDFNVRPELIMPWMAFSGAAAAVE